MLDKVNEFMASFGFTVIDGDGEYLSFSSSKKTKRQGDAILSTLKKTFGKKNLILDLFVYIDKIIIEVRIKT